MGGSVRGESDVSSEVSVYTQNQGAERLFRRHIETESEEYLYGGRERRVSDALSQSEPPRTSSQSQSGSTRDQHVLICHVFRDLLEDISRERQKLRTTTFIKRELRRKINAFSDAAGEVIACLDSALTDKENTLPAQGQSGLPEELCVSASMEMLLRALNDIDFDRLANTIPAQIDHALTVQNSSIRRKIDILQDCLCDIRSKFSSCPLQYCDDGASAQSSFKCPLCYNEDVTHVFAPCGHCVCNCCLTKWPTSPPMHCFMCRQAVRDVCKMYL